MSDEEYVPENHPLFSILNENGLNEEICKQDLLNTTDPPNHKKKSYQFFNSSFIFSYFDGKIQKIKRYFKSLEYNFLIKTLDLLQSSSLLTEEDYPLVAYQKDFLLSQSDSGSSSSVSCGINWILDHIGMLRCSAVAICSILSYQMLTNSIYWSNLSIICLLFLTVTIPSIYCKDIKEAKLILPPVMTLTYSLQEYNRISRRSILFVQEAEVIARGFTFVNKHSLGSSKFENVQTKHSGRQVPQFRRNLFLEIRKYIFSLRSMVLSLLNEYPAARSFDSVKCLVDIPATEFGACLTMPESDEDELMDCTQQFAIPLLKAMHEFTESHVSELMREICLVLTLNQRDKSLYQLSSLMNGWVPTIQTAANTLSHLYNLQRACSAPVLSTSSPTDGNEDDTASQSFKPLYSAVHSLSLHLQSVLHRVRDLEDKLETNCSATSSETPFIEESLVHCTLSSLEGEFNACRVCWEEALKLSSPVGHTADQGDCGENEKLQRNVNAAEKQAVPIIWALSDPIIEDEVLEAYVESDVEEENDCETFEDWNLTAAQGREKLRKEKEQAKKMLGELESVISVRAKDRKKREKIAKRKKAGLKGDIEDVSTSLSSSDPDDNSAPPVRKDNVPLSLNAKDIELTDTEKSNLRRRLAELPNSFQLGLASTVANQVLLERASNFQCSSGREETFIENSDLSD